MSPDFAAVLVQLHDAALSGSAAAWPDGPAWHWAEANHRCNRQLWDEEDQARRTDVPATSIAASKRHIDQLNQQRNDAVEALDAALLDALGPPQPGARLHSETAGAMADRLSILALKIHHMGRQARRGEADPSHRERCEARVLTLQQQRADLAACLARLLHEAMAGRSYFKVYRQYKMYNDPALNPWLHGQQARAGTERRP